jgi:hypothetical protein
LRWDIKLPNASLADEKYKLLVQHGQHLLLEMFNDGQSVAPDRLVSTHRRVLHLLEYLVLVDEDGALAWGFGCLDPSTAAQLVLAYERGGASGIADFQQRFRTWIAKEIDAVGRRALLGWLRNQTPDDTRRILDFNRSVQSYEPEGIPRVLITETPSFLRWARTALAQRGAYKNGILQRSDVARAIGTDESRLARSFRFSYELRQYEFVTDYRHDAYPRGSTRTEQAIGQASAGEKYQKGQNTRDMITCILKVSAVALHLPSLCTSDLADYAEMTAMLIPLTRLQLQPTRAIPKIVARALLQKSFDWMLGTAPGLIRMLEAAAQLAQSCEAVNATVSLVSRFEQCFQDLTEKRVENHRPSQFWRLLPTESRSAEKSGSVLDLGEVPVAQRQMGVIDLLDIHQAICLSVIAMLSCSRLTEVLDLNDGDLSSKNGRWYLEIRVRKQGTDGVRRVMHKPVPPGVAICIHSLTRIRQCLLPLTSQADHGDMAVFFSVVENGRLMSIATTESMYPRLDTMSEYFDLRTKEGIRWLVSPHQLRKFFAMSFFRDGDRGNSLPALSWFMGHGDDIEKTWAYLRSDLAEDEISSTEATWAAAALRTQPQDESVRRLRSILEEQFGSQQLNILNEDDLQEYLELLQSRGAYTATLKSIRDSRGARYTVLVHITKEA